MPDSDRIHKAFDLDAVHIRTHQPELAYPKNWLGSTGAEPVPFPCSCRRCFYFPEARLKWPKPASQRAWF